jgi:hypothetical protein
MAIPAEDDDESPRMARPPRSSMCLLLCSGQMEAAQTDVARPAPPWQPPLPSPTSSFPMPWVDRQKVAPAALSSSTEAPAAGLRNPSA